VYCLWPDMTSTSRDIRRVPARAMALAMSGQRFEIEGGQVFRYETSPRASPRPYPAATPPCRLHKVGVLNFDMAQICALP
jgi:hypothetical protein